MDTLNNYCDCLENKTDLYGDNHNGFSPIFYLWNKRYLHWLSNNPKVAVSKKETIKRRKFYRFLQKVGPSMLKCTQVFEYRVKELPKKPVIYVANHGFHDDVLATVLAPGRHAYLTIGNLPLLYNTIDGFACSLVGGICINRKNRNSRKATISKVLEVLNNGTDIIIFPEGGWNKTPEKWVLDLWHGVYFMSKYSGCDVVPIIHYIEDMQVLDKSNIIHTVVDKPIRMYEMEEDIAITYLRDLLATWQYKMAEKFGKTTRDILLQGITSQQKWEQLVALRMKSISRYDSQVEKNADYRPKCIVRPEMVFKPIAEIENISSKNIKMVIDARKYVEECEANDFQRRF